MDEADKEKMKIAVSSYVAVQISFIVAWMIGLFNISAIFALIPTFVALIVLAIMFGFLKLIECFVGLDDDDEFNCVLGFDEEEDKKK